MIIHINPQNNFTKISNAFIQDSNISAEAKMVAILLLSYPNDWIVNVHHLSKILNKGIATIRKALKELVEIGKLTISQQERDAQGRFTKDEKVYEFIGEVESQRVAELSEEEFAELRANTKADIAQSYPRDKKPACGKNDTHIKNNINNKEEIYIARDCKKTILLKSLFKIPKQALNLDFSSLDEAEIRAYEEFIKYREETRKLPPSTKKSILEKIKKLKEQGQEIRAVVQRSIENGWSGIFPIRKQDFSARSPQSRSTQRQSERDEVVGNSAEIALHNELLDLLRSKDSNFSLERLREDKIETARHRELGFVGIHKLRGRLRLCDKTQEAKYLERLRGNVAQEA